MLSVDGGCGSDWYGCCSVDVYMKVGGVVVAVEMELGTFSSRCSEVRVLAI